MVELMQLYFLTEMPGVKKKMTCQLFFWLDFVNGRGIPISDSRASFYLLLSTLMLKLNANIIGVFSFSFE